MMSTELMVFWAGLGVAAILGAVLVWPQAGLVLFLSIFMVKAILRAYMPFLVGYTYDMFVTGVAFVGVAWHAARVGRSVRGLIPKGCMAAWLILICLIWLTLPFSRQISYGWKKALIFSIFDTLTILLPLFYFRRFRDTYGLMLVCGVLGMFAIGSLIFFPTTMGNVGYGRTTVLYGSPLAPADFCSYLIIILVSLWIAQRRLWQSVLILGVVPLALYAIFLTGTRGPLFSLPIVLFTVLFLYRRTVNFTFIVSGALLGAIAVFATMRVLTPEITKRFEPQYIIEGFTDRQKLLQATVDHWLANPVLGNGTGDTAYQLGGPNYEGYPHNLLLEVANELGLIGLTCMLVIMGYALKSGFQFGRPEMEGTDAKALSVPFFGCFLHHLLFSFKTGGYAGSYTFYFFMGCTIALARLWKVEQASAADPAAEPWLSGYSYRTPISNWGQT